MEKRSELECQAQIMGASPLCCGIQALLLLLLVLEMTPHCWLWSINAFPILKSKLSLLKKDLDIAVITPESKSTQLQKSIEKLPEDQKYSSMVVHYGMKAADARWNNIKIPGQNKAINVLHSLCAEMNQRAIKLDPSAMKAYIDAVVNDRDLESVSLALRILKSGRQLRTFGSAVGLLSAPGTSNTSALPALPEDGRQAEVMWAVAALSVALTEALLQVGTMQDHDLHLWANVLVSATVTAAVLDATIRQGLALRRVTAGVERLLLVDKERQIHCDAASFLMGYLLGLPCFSYQPDVADVLALLRKSPEALRGYQQPAVQSSRSRRVVKDINWRNEDVGQVAKSGEDSDLATSATAILADLDDALATDRAAREVSSQTAQRVETELELGRVLVWLLAPVAAEEFKYGKAYLADPARAERLLEALAKGLKDVSGSVCGTPSHAKVIPVVAADRKELLRWAYYEATLLVRQYGVVLERVSRYMRAGTSSVGECVGMIEEMLSG